MSARSPRPVPAPSRAAPPLGRRAAAADLAARLVVAGIFAQTLYFKFTWAPETRAIFAELGGRPAATAAGLAELVAAVLVLIPATAVGGAALALGVMAGAIGSHLFVIGTEVVVDGQGDGGLLFGLALLVAGSAIAILVLRRRELAGLVARARGG